MSMFALPISVFELKRDNEMRAALRAGWRRSDLVWERLSEGGNRLLEKKHAKAARMRFGLASAVAWLMFTKGDLRRAASHANLAAAATMLGQPDKAKRYYHAALAIWAGAPSAIQAMEIAPRARSSLFHLRMETRHWDTYCDNMRIRMSKFASETDACLQARMAEQQAPHKLFARWKGEKPSVFDDTRKVLAACLLIAL